MKRLLAPVIILVSISIMLCGCSPASTSISKIPDVQLTMARLPAQGYIELSRSNENELDRIGLGGTSPSCEPAHLPYNEDGLFWSDKLSLDEGDVIKVTVYSQSPISWFGVDWNKLDVRGVLAMTDIDEDGWNFVAEYPEHSSTDTASGIMKLIYQISESGDYQILVKNSNPSTSYQLELTASLASHCTPGQSTENDDDD